MTAIPIKVKSDSLFSWSPVTNSRACDETVHPQPVRRERPNLITDPEESQVKSELLNTKQLCRKID
jgi:hypothetical protein